MNTVIYQLGSPDGRRGMAIGPNAEVLASPARAAGSYDAGCGEVTTADRAGSGNTQRRGHAAREENRGAQTGRVERLDALLRATRSRCSVRAQRHDLLASGRQARHHGPGGHCDHPRVDVAND